MRGFSLAETVFSSFFVFLLMLALFTLIPSAAWMTATSRHELIADSISRKVVEGYRNRDFDAVPLGPPSPLPAPENHEGLDFFTTVNVNAVPTSPDTQFSKRVQVTITWNTRNIAHELHREVWLVNVPKN